MKIIKRINTSAAIALDSSGREIVVLGKGIGFPNVPYELEDLSKIERTFYDIEPSQQNAIANIPEEIISICAKFADETEIVLNTELNANFVFTLADHLNFARERLMHGLDLTNPILFDVKYMYSKEYELAEKALNMLNDETGIMLPKSEIINVTLHIINAKKESNNASHILRNTRIISDITSIIEKLQNIQIDKESYEYSRFVKHITHLLQQFECNVEKEEKNSKMLNTLAKEYPDIYQCAFKITNYLKNTWKWNCNNDEVLYLMLHINRLLD